jgi:outer membrane protein OmpA-like peptidoglycan-associated protein
MALSDKDAEIRNITGKLCKPLEAGKSYSVQFYIKPYSGNALCSEISVLFSANAINNHVFIEQQHNSNKQMSSAFTPHFTYSYLSNHPDSFQQISFMYQAKGGEQFIHIGNFNHSRPAKWKPVNDFGYWKSNFHYSSFSTYAVSDIAVYPTDTSEVCPIFTNNPLINASHIFSERNKENDTFHLSNLLFDFNSYILTPEGELLLNKVAGSLKNDSAAFVTIIGYTDTTGTNDYNRLLSLKRAEAVRDYLLLKGLPLNQTTVIAGGESVEFAENQNNRFVKLIINRNANKQNHTITTGRYADNYTK